MNLSHSNTLALLTLLHIRSIPCWISNLPRFALESLNLDILHSLSMPPTQVLYCHSLNILIVNVPFTSAASHCEVGLGEVELRKIDLCRGCRCSWPFRCQRECECTILQIKHVAVQIATDIKGIWTEICLCGTITLRLSHR